MAKLSAPIDPNGRTVRPSLAVSRGVALRCARCGSRGLFARWGRLLARCPRCGLKLEREEGAFLGAFVVNFAVMQASVGLGIGLGVLLTLPDVPVLAVSAGAFAFSAACTVLAYPWSKTVWIALDLLMNPDREGDPDDPLAVRS